MRSRAVLITGCSSGIGRATALRLAADGWPVYATARHPDSLAELARAGCRTLALDVDDEDSMVGAVRAVCQAEGAVGVLVNNAGYGQWGALESIAPDLVRRQFETNVFGLVRLTQLVLPRMRAQGSGRIINIGSMGGKATFPGGALYHATKYSLEAISDALRFELRGFGIDVVLLEPGFISTRYVDAAEAAIPQDDGPYSQFNRHIHQVMASTYSGGLSALGGGPEVVAGKIAHVLAQARPRSRYPVTPSAHLTINLRRLTPDRVWDLLMRLRYRTPGG